MSMANPQQKQLINSMKGTSKEEQAQELAKAREEVKAELIAKLNS